MTQRNAHIIHIGDTIKVVTRNAFEMAAHQKQFEQFAPIVYKHRPSMGNDWPDAIKD